MAKFFIGDLPDILYHGSQDPGSEGAACLTASASGWWREMDWDDYDGGREGEERTAYANLVFEHLGLRMPDSGDVPGWAKGITTMDDLASRIGILFVTDDPEVAEARYGKVRAIDMTSPAVLDVAVDPNPGTYAAWILILDPTLPLPVIAAPGDAQQLKAGR